MSEFGIGTKIFFGNNAYQSFYEFLKGSHYRTFIAIVDDAIVHLAPVRNILKMYQEQGYDLKSICPFHAVSEPTYDMLDHFVDTLSCKTPDFIIAIGGGSVMDLAKGVGILLKNSGKGVAYRGMHKVQHPGIPVITYPSTGGTGSEVTWTAAFIDTLEHKKLGINGQYVAPLCGILDPHLVAICPRRIAVSAALDAMVHAVEAVTAKTATDITVLLGSYAFSTIYQYLPMCLSQANNLLAWEQIQIAAYLAGVALMNAGGGPASAISYPLGVHYGVPHGFSGGVFLPGVFKLNIEKGYQGYLSIYNRLFDANYSLDDSSKLNDFLEKFNRFYDHIGAPRYLTEWDCTDKQAIEKLTHLTMVERLQNVHLNPIDFGEKEIRKLLEEVCA